MQVLRNTETDISMTEDYNLEPVYYCKKCLSLRIMALDDSDYCDICGSTDVEVANINNWNQLYKDKYGKEF